MCKPNHDYNDFSYLLFKWEHNNKNQISRQTIQLKEIRMKVNVVGRVLLASVEIRAANKKFKKHVKAKGLTINLFKIIMQVCLSRQLLEYNMLAR